VVRVQGESWGDDVVGQVLDALRSGTGVLLTGVAGAGSGALAERTAGVLAEDGWQVVRVPGRPGVRGRPLGALSLAGPPARAASGEPLALAVTRVQEAAGNRRAVLLARRADLLDEETRAVLATVVDRTAARPLLTSRPDRSSRLAALRAAGEVPVAALAVPSLRFDDLLAVLADELGAPAAPDAAARVYALSAGLPGVARAIVSGARRAGALVEAGGAWTAVADLRTPGLETVVDQLLERLDGEARSALGVLATLGPASPDVVRRVLGWDELAALEDAGVVRLVESGDRTEVVVVPPLVAEHLVTSRNRVEELRARDRVEQALGVAPGDAADAPAGMAVTGWAASREGVAVLGRRLRHAAGIRLAVRRAEWQHEPTPATTVRLLDAMTQAGAARAEVEEVVAAARERTAAGGTGAVDEWYARYLGLACGEPDAALAVPAAPGTDGRRARARLELLLGRPLPPAEPAAPADAPADAPEDDDTRGDATPPDPAGGEAADAWPLLARGRVRDALEAVGPEDAPEHDLPTAEDRAVHGIAAILAGSIDAAIRDAGRVHDAARVDLDGPAMEISAAVAAFGLALAGRSRELREHLAAALALGPTAPLQPWARAGLLCVGAALAAADHRVVAARALADGLTALRLPLSPVPLTSAVLARLRVSVVAGEDPREGAVALWREVDQSLDRGFVAAAVLSGAAAAEVLPDHPVAARVAAAGAASQGTVLPLLGRYVAALASGRPDRAAEVAPALDAAGLRIHTVRAHARAASLAALQGDPASAQSELAAADAVVARAGGDLDGAVDAMGPVSGLSGRELEIARLVAAGSSNRQVAEALGVSVRTIDNHLYRIYRKVGVSDRESLARRIH
jgi:DNA-binding CsgD family transcriptional regulator